MKSVALCIAFFACTLLNAQNKVTKSSVIGKWGVVKVEMPGIVEYDVETDSLSFGEMVRAQVKDATQLSLLTSTTKAGLAFFTKITFTFNADGTDEMGGGTPQADKGTYLVDEENSVIKAINSDKTTLDLKSEMKDDHLRITMKQPQGDVFVTLKRVK